MKVELDTPQAEEDLTFEALDPGDTFKWQPRAKRRTEGVCIKITLIDAGPHVGAWVELETGGAYTSGPARLGYVERVACKVVWDA